MSSLLPRARKSLKDDIDNAKLFPIVGIGTSAGGLEAATDLLKHLPMDTGFGFVLVQHLDPQHESALTQILSRATSLPVSEITNRISVEPNHIYVIPPNTTVRVSQQVLLLEPRHSARSPYYPIDSFLESLAQERQDRAIGVILSGTGTDGTLGLEAIKSEGGITFAQDGSARYDSMPRSAAASGNVDFVLSPENIAKELTRIATHPYVIGKPVTTSLPDKEKVSARVRPAESSEERPEGDEGLRRVLSLLRNHCGVDFSLYKSTTIERRIARRVVVNKLNSLEDYVFFLENNAKELDALYSDMLISVTSFFRNPEAFDVLKYKIFPKLLQQRGQEPIRVWVLGCSTGQEAYSIAMVFSEAAENIPRPRSLQIFATDLNEKLLEKARHGLYSRNLVQAMPPDRLRRFFTEGDGGYRISKSLREAVVFARQNVMNDPPFSRMDLISCRNLLIYLDPSVQRRAMSAFHYALKPEGFLFLGASESVGNFTDLFESVDKTHRIYCRKPAPARAIPLPVHGVLGKQSQPAMEATKEAGTPGGTFVDNFHGDVNAQREADRVAVNRFAPPCILVDADHQVLQFRGATGAYLQPPSGKASFDLLKMAREGLMLPLRATFNKAKKENRVVRKEDVRLRQGGKTRRVNIEVIPLKNLKERFFLVAFEETAPGITAALNTFSAAESTGAEIDGVREEAALRIAELESELSETREYLQSVHERQETANEELQASNEEVQSANEELQSINEELETSKEELESTNEELTTINEEMVSRNAELSRLNSDLVNIQTSARLPIVLLGRDLTVRRFSSQAEKLFNLVASDIGRSFHHIRHSLVMDDERDSLVELENLIADVIATVREQEQQVRDADGRWYSLRIRPYMTLDNKVEGAVLVLVDISDLKQTEQHVSSARDYAEAIIRTVRDPLIILNADLRVHAANDAFYRTFRLLPEECTGRLIYELGNKPWQTAKLRPLLEDILPRKSFFDDLEITLNLPDIGRRTLLLNGRKLDIDGQPARILLGIQDVTETLSFQAAAREDAERFRVLFDRSPMPKWTVDPTTLGFLNVNQAAVAHYGYSEKQFTQMSLKDLIAPEARDAFQKYVESPTHSFPEKNITRHRKNDGLIIDVEVRTNEITIAGKSAWLATINDITELMRAEQALQALNEELARDLAATLQLQQISIQLLQEDMPDALYEQTLHAAVTITQSDMASIQIVDDKEDALRLLASHGFDAEFTRIFQCVKSHTKTSCGRARQEGRRVIVPDVDTCEFLAGTSELESYRKVGIRAVQSTPLIARNARIIGVISTHWRNPHTPSESDFRLLDILARQTADLIERNNAEQSLRDADRRKNEFLAVLAHELRTPLSPIKNGLAILRTTNCEPEQLQAAAQMMERQVKQMVHLIDDLMDVSRIGRGKIDLRRERIDLASVLNCAVETSRPLFESKKLQVSVSLPEEPILINADPLRLTQAVGNLLNNAAKFTDSGGRISLSAQLEGNGRQAVIRVRDNGIGIEASQLQRIFEMFTQVETSLDRAQSGLGIGLALSKKLVELHDGELEVQSGGVGQGTEFTLRLPTRSEASAAIA